MSGGGEEQAGLVRGQQAKVAAGERCALLRPAEASEAGELGAGLPSAPSVCGLLCERGFP